MNRSFDQKNDDPSKEKLDKVRKEFLAIARGGDGKKTRRRRKTWFTQWTPDVPTDWRPYTVMNPAANGLPFTEEGARQFIIDLLEEFHPSFEEKQLDDPPGGRAYTFLVELDPDKPKLYIKIQLGAGCILGRSFHYSYHDTGAGEKQ